MDITTPQPDLLAQLGTLVVQRNAAAEAFDLFKQDAVMAPAPEPAAGDVSSDDAATVAAEEVDVFAAQAEGLMASATDDELLDAYRGTEGEVGDLVAEILLAEIQRRDLKA